MAFASFGTYTIHLKLHWQLGRQCPMHRDRVAHGHAEARGAHWFTRARASTHIGRPMAAGAGCERSAGRAGVQGNYRSI